MEYTVRYIEDDKMEAGIDEAGRGPFWGPLMAAAVILPAEETWTEEQKKLFAQVRDSKKISEKKRKVIADGIKKHAAAWAIGTVTAQEIDDNGMTWSNQTAFFRAVQGLQQKPDRLIVDGTVPLSSNWSGEQHTVVDGDAIYLSVAAASILAKVIHDEWIISYCDEHPELDTQYNLKKCKGYGTARHIAGIREHGLHEHHRRLFLRKLLGQAERPQADKAERPQAEQPQADKAERPHKFVMDECAFINE